MNNIQFVALIYHLKYYLKIYVIQVLARYYLIKLNIILFSNNISDVNNISDFRLRRCFTLEKIFEKDVNIYLHLKYRRV